MNTPPTGLPPGGTFRDDELCSAIAHDWREFPKSSIAILRAHVAAQLEESRTANAALEAENRALVAALLFCDAFADQCETAEDRSNLDGDSAETVLLQINEAATEARAMISKALAPKEGNAP